MTSQTDTEVTQPEQQAPPTYEDAPDYSPESYHKPLVTYHLRVARTNVSNLVPFGLATASDQPAYEVAYRSSTALPFFKKKGDISVSRTWLSSADSSPTVIARADFHDEGPLPYCPRARFTLTAAAERGADGKVEMQSKDWRNWTFQHDTGAYCWTLREIPACIELASAAASAPPVIARPTYGKVGTKVLAGGEVGQLEVWSDGLTQSVWGREAVILGCLVVVKYFQGLGRRYRNDGTGGSGAGALVNPKGQENNKVRSKVLLF